MNRSAWLLFLFALSCPAALANTYDANFRTNIEKRAVAFNDPNASVMSNAYLWPVTEDEMKDSFFDSLKSLINAYGTIDESNEYVIYGDLMINDVAVFVFTHVYIEYEDGKITEAYPIPKADETTYRIPVKPDNATLAKIRQALTYSGTPNNWESFRRSKAVESVKWGFRDNELYVQCRRQSRSLVVGELRRKKKKSGNLFTLQSPCPPGDGAIYFHYEDGRIYNPTENADVLERLPPRAGANTNWRLHMFNVNSGNSSLLLCPITGAGPRGAVLFDAGTTGSLASDATNGRSRVLNRIDDLIRDEDIGTLDVVISHEDGDHVNFLADVLNLDIVAGKLRHVFLGAALSSLPDDLDKTIPRMVNGTIWEGAKGTGGTGALETKIVRLPAGTLGTGHPYQIGRFSSDTTKSDSNWATVSAVVAGMCGGVVKFLAANEIDKMPAPFDTDTSSNRRSIVAMIDDKVVLTADASASALQRAVQSATSASVTRPLVLSVPHHGSHEIPHFPVGWTNWARPKYLVYQAGNAHDHPSRRSFNLTRTRGSFAAFEGYEDATTGSLPAGENKSVFMVDPLLSSLPSNVKTPQVTQKQVFVTSDTGELVIENNGADVKISCVGPFGNGVGGGRRWISAANQTEPNLRFMADANKDCIPPPLP